MFVAFAGIFLSKTEDRNMIAKWIGGLLVLAFLLTGVTAWSQNYRMVYSFTSMAGNRNASSTYEMVNRVSILTPEAGFLSSPNYSLSPVESAQNTSTNTSVVRIWYLF